MVVQRLNGQTKATHTRAHTQLFYSTRWKTSKHKDNKNKFPLSSMNTNIQFNARCIDMK